MYMCIHIYDSYDPERYNRRAGATGAARGARISVERNPRAAGWPSLPGIVLSGFLGLGKQRKVLVACQIRIIIIDSPVTSGSSKPGVFTRIYNLQRSACEQQAGHLFQVPPQGQMDGLVCQLPYKCHLKEVALVRDFFRFALSSTPGRSCSPIFLASKTDQRFGR